MWAGEQLCPPPLQGTPHRSHALHGGQISQDSSAGALEIVSAGARVCIQVCVLDCMSAYDCICVCVTSCMCAKLHVYI